MKPKGEIVFEESLSDDWSRDLGVVEVPLDERPLSYLGVVVALVGVLLVGRIVFLNVARGEFYDRRADANLYQTERIPAPRGIITDHAGTVLADNRPVFTASLNLKEFLRQPGLQDRTMSAITDVLQVSSTEVWQTIAGRDVEQSIDPIVLDNDLAPAQMVALKGLDLSTIIIGEGFKREYPEGEAFSSVLGTLGYPTREELAADDALAGNELVGKDGVESFYDGTLRGTAGETTAMRNAKGTVLESSRTRDPELGQSLTLTIDAEFQRYFAKRFTDGLKALGRTSGVGIAMDPRSGEILALMNFPLFDNNVFTGPGQNDEKQQLLSSTDRPLFDRAVAGLYSPGSTIKPLHALAALVEGVISPARQIFSPGYLDIPNPFDPDHPTRLVDWRYQGNVDMAAALAQSSNVYFYEVGGGYGDIRGLGIERLHDWWERFHLGQATGIDLPGEATGFLPTIEWKERTTGQPWLVGDTYNVSIGQGDLLVTPIALLDYIAAIANGGVVYEPHVAKTDVPPTVLADYREYTDALAEVQSGMREAVTSPLGTANLLSSLPFATAAKTGSAQVFNKAQENAFFVGYAPAKNPQIAILVLIENSKEGSLNAVPIAKDALSWYYEHRIANSR
jgi:penicillin-binding protein 2